MFTGIIEAVGALKSFSGGKLETSVPDEWTLADGESVAVNGVCLTVVSRSAGLAAFDVSGETREKTALGSLKKGSRVNLERAMKADGRFSGHFVTGHVDGAARLLAARRSPGNLILSFEAPPSPLLVEKGSAALDGISLTVFGIVGRVFKTAVIPHTWEHTGLKYLKPGSPVNIEYDILGKYALKYARPGVTKEFLEKHGF